MKHLRCRFCPGVIGILAILTLLYDVGFEQSEFMDSLISTFYLFFLLFIVIGIPIRYILSFPKKQRLVIWITDLLFWGVCLLVIINRIVYSVSEAVLIPGMVLKIWLVPLFIINLIREVSRVDRLFKNRKINPALLFAGSFFLLCLTGSLLLMMPKANHAGISFTDAFFTSTSAVCVTGLVVVDTGSHFTPFGQVLILILIQLGGIGIMTFTSVFVFFFKGGTSFQNLIIMGDLASENKFANVFNTLLKIVVFTLLIEAAGAVLIYFNLTDPGLSVPGGRLFFSVFHSISAFCNAGFSNLSQSLSDIHFRFNYPLHLVIALLIILGGLGFPVAINIYSYLKNWIKQWMPKTKAKQLIYSPARIISLNTRIVAVTSLVLVLAGTLSFYLLEFNNTLSEHQGIGKLVTAFFGAVTPRTAGFNSVDTGNLHLPTIALVIVLMWIGASPASTGGGIKTSTIALAVLNVMSIVRGRSRINFYRREISSLSVNRAFAIIVLSLLVIGSSAFLLTLTEPGKAFSDLIFEVVSAFSTVGLSTGITADLTPAGKYVIILTMFVGRVGTLTLLVAFFRNPRTSLFKFPSEGVLIN
jgi:potassium uptake TrkH family protein